MDSEVLSTHEAKMLYSRLGEKDDLLRTLYLVGFDIVCKRKHDLPILKKCGDNVLWEEEEEGQQIKAGGQRQQED